VRYGIFLLSLYRKELIVTIFLFRYTCYYGVMNTSKKPAASQIPKVFRCLNTGMAVILLILGIYHYTQPNAAWRSGTVESLSALLLLAAAWLVSPVVAAVINGCIAVVMAGFGIRHAAIGGGWVSGSIELLFAALLVVSSVTIYRKRRS
jgi:hypothetical protein